MITNPVIEAIFAAFRLEITNPFTLTQPTLIITFPDQSRAVINVQQIGPTSPSANAPLISTPNNTHTWQYLHQHHSKQHSTQLLTLQSIEDCRAYLDDICHNLLNAPCATVKSPLPTAQYIC